MSKKKHKRSRRVSESEEPGLLNVIGEHVRAREREKKSQQGQGIMEGDTGQAIKAAGEGLGWLAKKIAPTQAEKTQALEQEVAKLKEKSTLIDKEAVLKAEREKLLKEIKDKKNKKKENEDGEFAYA